MLDWFLDTRYQTTRLSGQLSQYSPAGMGHAHGEQRGLFDLSFAIPAECADRLESGLADIGIVPAVELNRQKLEIIRGAGIACHGPVRSIFLISKVPSSEIRKLAADSTSRTSVALSRVILSRKYGVEPEVRSHAPHLPSMLEHADAALIIGDAALVLDPADLPFHVLDLGAEWVQMTGLPMVFAVWAARAELSAAGSAAVPGIDALRTRPYRRHRTIRARQSRRFRRTGAIVFERQHRLRAGRPRVRRPDDFPTICFRASDSGWRGERFPYDDAPGSHRPV